MKNKCEYSDCGKKVYAIERLTDTDMKLCLHHFQLLFQKLTKNAEIIDETEND